MRAKLERNSPRTACVNVVDRLNAMALGDAMRQSPGFDGINAIRKAQRQSGYKTSTDHSRAFEKIAAEGFNRLHPGAGGGRNLARHTRVPRDPEWSEPGYQSYIPGKTRTVPSETLQDLLAKAVAVPFALTGMMAAVAAIART